MQLMQPRRQLFRRVFILYATTCLIIVDIKEIECYIEKILTAYTWCENRPPAMNQSSLPLLIAATYLSALTQNGSYTIQQPARIAVANITIAQTTRCDVSTFASSQ